MKKMTLYFSFFSGISLLSLTLASSIFSSSLQTEMQEEKVGTSSSIAIKEAMERVKKGQSIYKKKYSVEELKKFKVENTLSEEEIDCYNFLLLLKEDKIDTPEELTSLLSDIKERGLREGASAVAQNTLASLYQEGQGVEKDYDQARKLYQSSAEKGNADAQNSLGYFCQNGLGGEECLEQAQHWYELAANQGHRKAQFNSAYLCRNLLDHEDEEGRDDHWGKAVKQYKKAGAQGDSQASFEAAKLYRFPWWNGYDYGKAIIAYQQAITKPIESFHPAAYEVRQMLTFPVAKLELQPLEESFEKLQASFNDKMHKILRENTISVMVLPSKYEGKMPHDILKDLNGNYFQFQELYLNKISNLLDQSGFMVANFRIPETRIQLELKNNSLVKIHSIGGTSYITFGKENVKQADRLIVLLQLMKLVSVQINSWKESQGDAKSFHNLDAELKNVIIGHFELQKDLVDLITEGASLRTQKFLEQYPYLQHDPSLHG